MELSEYTDEQLRQVIFIESRRIRDLGAQIADRVGQDVRSIGTDPNTGELMGLLSNSARAARYALARLIVLRGGEDPGWGF
jgi:erythromycin esterase-like protein